MESSAGEDPTELALRSFPGDTLLLAAARRVKAAYRAGRVVEGVISSAEVWNSELDRITQFHQRYGTLVEEMETASAAQIAGVFKIPFLGVRVLSNNITNGGQYNPRTGDASQDFV